MKINFSFQVLGNAEFRHKYQVTRGQIDRLGLEKQLEGHDGCVNCIQWSDDGELLASGSDDTKVIVWDPFKGRIVHEMATGHSGNIFSVKFMPGTSNNLIASGAADFKIQLHDMEASKTIETYKKHLYRVKRLEVSPGCPNIIWSASEDGSVM
jgi:WD and tetratricopeptide repeat-containing protein 1